MAKKIDIDTLVQQADSHVMGMCGPDRMTQHDALAFLEALSANIDGAIDALKEEMDDMD